MNGSTMRYAVTAAVALVIGFPLMFLLLLSSDANSCGSAAGGDAGPAPTAEAGKGIPSNYLKLYRETGKKYDIPWWVLAGIGKVETDHGRLKAQGVQSGANFAGAAGPMQIGIGGAASDNWSRPEVGIDGNHDGKKDVHDPEDAIPGAARYLKASGAKTIREMIFSYNHADWYVAKVMDNARSYAGKSANDLASAPNGGPQPDCSDAGGIGPTGSGKYQVAPGANRAGVPITRDLDRYLQRMAGAYKALGAKTPLVLTTGTQHSQMTASGNVSDHWTGNGADFGMVLNKGTNSGPVGDRIAAAAFLVAGVPEGEAIKRGRQGGLVSVNTSGLRVQIIWLSADHYDHVHVGVQRR